MTFIKNDKRRSNVILLILVALITANIIFYCFSDGISGNDFWWHIKVGEYICSHGHVPTSDIFSWYGTANELPWTAHEWLADVIFYLIFSSAGEAGIFFFCVLCAVGMTALMFCVGKRDAVESPLAAGLFFALFAVVSSLYFYGRPHIFSYFFLFLELYILYRFSDDNGYKGIYFLPLLAVLWSNIHGGSSNLIYILPAIFLVVGAKDLKIGRIESTGMTLKGKSILAAVTVGSVVGILINPIGLRVLSYPYESFADKLSLSFISEWQPPDAKNIGSLVMFFFPIGIMCFCMAATEKKIKLRDVAVMAVFLLLFFRSTRFIVMWYISAVFCAFPYMPECKVSAIVKKAEKAVVLTVAVLLSVMTVLSAVKMISAAGDDGIINKAMSDDAVEAVREDGPKRIFNDYNVGETLIANDIPVFFDARADLYRQDNILADGVGLMYMTPAEGSEGQYLDVEKIMEKYGFDAVLILKVRPLYSYLISHPEKYECIYEDGDVGYFRVTETSG